MTERCVAADTEEIRNLVARAADGVCRRDTALWAGTWSRDGVWALFDSEIVGRDEIRERWVKGMAKYSNVNLLVFNGQVFLDGADDGHGTWYILEVNRTVEGETSMMIGVYDDRYVRTDEGWRFARRQYHKTYLGPVDPGEMTLPPLLPGSQRLP